LTHHFVDVRSNVTWA